MPKTPVIVLGSGVLAGFVADATRWIFSTADMVSGLPWMPAEGVAGPSWLLTALVCLLSAGYAWLGFAVRGKWRAVALLVGGIALCFTGSAALSLHGVSFDPIPPVVGVLLGWLAGWGLTFTSLSTGSNLLATFTGRLSPEMMKKLAQMKPQPDVQGENRPVSVLTCRMLNEAAVRQTIGPAAFLKLAEEFRQRAHSALLARGGLLVPGPTELIQACFGLPIMEKSYARDACQGALLLQAVLSEFISQRNPRGGGALRFGIGLSSGTAASGMLEGEYQILGSVVETSRQLSGANANWKTCILVDGETLRLAGAGLLTRPIDLFTTPDSDEPVELSELVPPGDVDELPAQRERLRAFADGVALQREGEWARAVEEFERSLPRDGKEDPTAMIFLESAQQAATQRRPEPAPRPRQQELFPEIEMIAPVAVVEAEPDTKAEAASPETHPALEEDEEANAAADSPDNDNENGQPSNGPATTTRRRRRRGRSHKGK